MANEFVYAAYALTWVVLIAFTTTTVRRLQRAERAARALALQGEEL